MKFPLITPMFPPVVLSPAECSRFEQLAAGLVGTTLAEYDLYNGPQQRHVSKQQWKPVKSRENITVYKDRSYDPDNTVHRGLVSSVAVRDGDGDRPSVSSAPPSISTAIQNSIPAAEWNLPKLLMAGTLAGTLDDVMYGLATPDPGLILLKAHYSHDEVVDGQVLAQIQGPSAAEPFRFLGLKWLVKGNPPGVNAVVLPRDIVLLESTGIVTHPVSGERIGHFMMHSVELDSCPLLPKKEVVRANLSTCYIFRELPGGVVDVYMTGYFVFNGKVVDPIAIVSAANGLLCCWKAVVCAQSKKLVWLLKSRLRDDKRRLHSNSSASVSSSSSWDGAPHQHKHQQRASPNCGMCAKSFKVFNSVACCQLCDAAMCSRCRVTVRLAFPRPGEKDLRIKSVVLCKGCLTSASQTSTLEIAQQEVLSGRFGSLYSSLSARPSASSTASIRASNDTVATNKEPAAMQENLTSSILTAQVQEYAQSTVSGAGATILHAHALERKVSAGAAYLSTLSAADTTKNSEFNSNYTDNSDYESLDDQPQSEDDFEIIAAAAVAATTEPMVVDSSGAVTNDWGDVSPSARQKYLDTVQGHTPEEQAMWKRMAQLHLQAETLYQVTKKNTESLFQGDPAGPGATVSLMPPVAPGYPLSPRMSID